MKVLGRVLRAMLLLCAWAVTLMIAGVWLSGTDSLGRAVGGTLWLCYFLMLPISLLNIAAAVLSGRSSAQWPERLRRAAVTKLLLIPFFLVNLLLGVISLMTGILFGPMLLLALYAVLAAWTTMLSTSADVIVALSGMGRQGIISRKQRIGHTVCQLIFVADVLDAWLLYWRNAKGRKPAGQSGKELP